MATPVLCCGAECGINGNLHWSAASTGTFSTSTVRTGLRSVRVNPTAAVGNAPGRPIFGGTMFVGRFYLYIASNPAVDCGLVGCDITADGKMVGLIYKASDGKCYAGRDNAAPTFGATGVTVSTGTWHLVDVKVNVVANPWTIDVRVDGVDLGQHTVASAASTINVHRVGSDGVTHTFDIFVDDVLVSLTSGDYPLGAGYVLSYIPNADGSHNVAGAADFKKGTNATPAGVDITNATTDAYQWIDERPLPTTSIDFINGIAPPNATDYVEWQYEDSAEPVAPRAVEAIIVYHDAGGAGTDNFSVTLRDSNGGTTADIMPAATRNVGTTISYSRAHFATIPGGGAWTTLAFNALRSRFLVSDASPDPYIDAAMLEAEFVPVVAGKSPPPFQRPWRRWNLRRN